MFYALSHLNPTFLNDRISLYIALAPSMRLQNATDTLLKYYSDLTSLDSYDGSYELFS